MSTQLRTELKALEARVLLTMHSTENKIEYIRQIVHAVNSTGGDPTPKIMQFCECMGWDANAVLKTYQSKLNPAS